MAENASPGGHAPIPSKSRRSTPRPPMTDRNSDIPDVVDLVDPARMLISPPPEETFRRVSRTTPFTPSLLASSTVKRKRVVASNPAQPLPESPSQPAEATPNPKPRKQLRQHIRGPSIDSPTRPSSTRRTATPIPSYEPPDVVYTPPREVIMTPTISKSSKRKTVANASKGKGKALKVDTLKFVKQELPDIDLSAPMPPASPSDDPLLLSGPIVPPTSTPVRPKSVSEVGVEARPLPSSSSPIYDPAPSDPPIYFDWLRHIEPEGSTDLSMDLDDDVEGLTGPLRLFDLNDLPSSSGGWSDSDDDDRGAVGHLEGQGEYTGKWRMMKVRTKLDPPSSATRGRIESWGRPISPFPTRMGSLIETDADDDDADDDDADGGAAVVVDATATVVAAIADDDDAVVDDAATAAATIVNDDSLAAGEERRSTLVEEIPNVMGDAAGEEEEEISSDEDGSDVDDIGVVKITSADPRAAARAAAILKQHDYDCFTKVSMKRRRKSYSNVDSVLRGARRKSAAGAGVVKSISESKRRATMGGVIGDHVFIPGSPVMTLPELLREAEVGLQDTSSVLGSGAKVERNPFQTPLPAKYRQVVARSGLAEESTTLVDLDEPAERAWGKEDWKQLDACFTDERLAVGIQLGLPEEGLANVDAVLLDDVVARYVEIMGGDERINKLGDVWTRENILRRAKALQNKQRSGNVAPPTTPYISHHGISQRLPSLEVPDFTPLGRCAFPPRKPRATLPSPTIDGPFSDLPKDKPMVPASLLAPRYSHLLDEAIAINQKGVDVLDKNLTNVGLSDASEDAPLTYIIARDNEPIASYTRTPRAPATIGGRVKGFLFSYLPTLNRTAPPPTRKAQPAQPGLPLPPLDLLAKPRGPISTPVREPPSKPKHPKDLVTLQPAPQPVKPSMIPRVVKPQRLVELHPPPPSVNETVSFSRPRRSSGGSVKDLVRSFEEWDESKEGGSFRKVELMKTQHAGDWKKEGKHAKSKNPQAWRP